MLDKGDFDNINAEAHFGTYHKQQRSELVRLLRKLAEGEKHSSFSNWDISAAIFSAAFAGLDVVAAILRTDSMKIRTVVAAEDYLERILFPEQSPGHGLGGRPLKDFLNCLANDLEEVDQDVMFRQTLFMRAAWWRISRIKS